MCKRKTVAAWIALLLLTGGIVLVPWLWNEVRLQSVIAQTEVWEYNGYIAPTLTSRELVQMIRRGEVNIGTGMVILNKEIVGASSEEGFESAKTVLRNVLNNSDGAALTEALTEERVEYCEHYAGFAVKDGRTILLNIADVCFVLDGMVLEIGVEEKTGTLLRVYCSGTSEQEYVKMISKAARLYFTEELGLEEGKFFMEYMQYEDSLQTYATLFY